MALPKNVSADRVAFLEEGFKKIFNDPKFCVLAKQKGLILVYEDADGFESFLGNMEQVLQPTLYTRRSWSIEVSRV